MNVKTLQIFLLAFLCLPVVSCVKAKVAVIGAGIGGSAVSHYLREHFQVDVFEKSSRVGGRTMVTKIEGSEEYISEVGASVYHAVNRNMAGWVQNFGLKTTKPYEGGSMGLWDGEDFRIQCSSNRLVAMGQAFWRWGWSLFPLQRAEDEVVNAFMKIYDLLYMDEAAFSDVDDLLTEVGLFNFTQQTLENHLVSSGVSKQLISELVTGVTRVNYAQVPHNMNAFAGAVGLKGAGNALYSVQGGNHQVSEKLLSSSKANLYLSSTVTGISYSEQTKKYTLTVNGTSTPSSSSSSSSSSSPSAEYDVVVVAAPFNHQTDVLPTQTAASHVEAMRQLTYQTLHVTFVTGCLDNAYFNNVSEVPGLILTTDNDDSIPFTSIGKLPWNTVPCPTYKIFAKQQLTQDLLKTLFKNFSWVERFEWEAYPKLHPLPHYPPVQLHDSLFYINAFEFTVSTLETTTLSAKNVANLIYKKYHPTKPHPNKGAHDEL